MANAARVHAVERGKDPRSVPAVRLRRRRPGARLPRRRDPARAATDRRRSAPGVTSTVGFLAAPLAFDFVRSFVRPARPSRLGARSMRLLAEMEGEGDAILAAARACPTRRSQLRRSADMRYVGQGHEVRVTCRPVSSDRQLAGDAIAGVRAGLPAALRADRPERRRWRSVSWRLRRLGSAPDRRSCRADGRRRRHRRGRR